jgi:hypothetical protein
MGHPSSWRCRQNAEVLHFVQDDNYFTSMTYFEDLLRRQGVVVGTDGAADWESFTSADCGDVFPAAGFGLAGQEAPGFAVFFVSAFAGAARAEVEHGMSQEGLDGDDVPDVFGNDVGREEVDVVFGVVVALAAAADYELAKTRGAGAFHLDAPKCSTGADQDIVGIALSPRFGDAEIEAGSSGDEFRLGGFSATLTVGTANSAEFGDLLDAFFASRFPLGRFVPFLPHNKKGAAGGLRLKAPFFLKYVLS